jgi:hypothetical protein
MFCQIFSSIFKCIPHPYLLPSRLSPLPSDKHMLQGIATGAIFPPGSAVLAYNSAGFSLCMTDCSASMANSSNSGLSSVVGGGGEGETRTAILSTVAAVVGATIPLLGALVGVFIFARKNPAAYTALAKVLPRICLPSRPVRLTEAHTEHGASGHSSAQLERKKTSLYKFWTSAQSRQFRAAQRADCAVVFTDKDGNTDAAEAAEQAQLARAAAAAEAARRHWLLSYKTAAEAAAVHMDHHGGSSLWQSKNKLKGPSLMVPAPFWQAKDQLPSSQPVLASSSRVGGGNTFAGLENAGVRGEDYELEQLIALEMPDSQSGAPNTTKVDAEQQWRQDLLIEAQRSVNLKFRGTATNAKFYDAGEQPATQTAVGSTGEAVLLTTAVRRESEAILFRTNLRNVPVQGIWPQNKMLADPDSSSSKRVSSNDGRNSLPGGRRVNRDMGCESLACRPAARKAPKEADAARSPRSILLPRDGGPVFGYEARTPLEELRAARISGHGAASHPAMVNRSSGPSAN